MVIGISVVVSRKMENSTSDFFWVVERYRGGQLG